MKSKLEYANLGIAAIVGYLYQCMSSGNLIFLDWLVNEHAFAKIKEASGWILLALGLLYVLFFILIRHRSTYKEQQKRLDRLSKHLFHKIINTDPSIDHSTFRVTIFEAKHATGANPRLKAIGRYQKRMPLTKPKVTFEPSEGCVGLCFATQQNVSKQIDPFDARFPEKYYVDCEKQLSLRKEKAEKINTKSCTYLCLPLVSHDTNQTWGVVVIDSTVKTLDFENQSRALEEIMANYSFMFSMEEIV